MDFESKIRLAVEMAHYRIELAKIGGSSQVMKDLVAKPLHSNGSNHEDDYSFTVRAMVDLIDNMQTQHDAKRKK